MTKVSAVEVATTSNTKPSNGETLITLVLDETGSMYSCLDSTIASVNDYLGTQKAQEGVARVNLYKFSDTGQFYATNRTAPPVAAAKIRPVCENTLVQDVVELNKSNFVPNGGTNLYDAIGHTVRTIEAQLEGMSATPAVLVVIVTDGGENASCEYTLATIKQMVADKEAQGWTFIYLGANQNAWQVGASFGLSKGQTMTYNTADMAGTMQTLSESTTRYRSSRLCGARAFNAVETDFFSGDADKE